MRRKTIGRRFIAAALSAFLFLPCVGCTREDPIVQTELTLAPEAPIAYGEGVKKRWADSLHKTVGNVLKAKLGEGPANVWKKDESAVLLLQRLGTAFEKRGAPFTEYESIMHTLSENEELLRLVLDKDKQAGERFARLFGTFTTELGVERTALIAYDFVGLYCQYQWERYDVRYRKEQLTYLLKERDSWGDRKEGISRIGEVNFSSLLRFWLSGLTVFSAGSDTPTELLSSLYAGEAALYLRTQGQVLQKLSLTEKNYEFLFAFAGEVGGVRVFKAVVKAGKHVEYAKYAAGVMQSLSKALLAVDDDGAELLLAGKTDEFVRRLWSALSEEERAPFIEALNVENDEVSYGKYIKDNKLTEKFEGYCNGERGEVENRIYEHSPQLAFLVFGK